jgi:DNA/RNA endonuclease G (NUC1)
MKRLVVLCVLFCMVGSTIGRSFRVEKVEESQLLHEDIPHNFDGYLSACHDQDGVLYNVNNVFSSCFKREYGTPLWTIHSMNWGQLHTTGPKRKSPSPWFLLADSNLMPRGMKGTGFSHYKLNGKAKFDQGHLVPNGDMKTVGDKLATFTVINRAPQLAVNNQGGWRCLESSLRSAAKDVLDEGDQIVVVTLLQFSNNDIYEREKFNGAAVRIPTAFSKIVYVQKSGQILTAFCVVQSARALQNPVVTDWRNCPVKDLVPDIPLNKVSDTQLMDKLISKLFSAPDQQVLHDKCRIIPPACTIVCSPHFPS